jgi:ParB-like chromosome segregation protein Spo0J
MKKKTDKLVRGSYTPEKNRLPPPPPIELKPDPANPNRMSAEDKGRMIKSLAEFGDLSGICLNRRTGMLVGGHQRTDVLKDGKLDVTDLDKPEPDGTVARGWLLHQGRRYTVRVVDWPERKARAALLAANRFGRVGEDDRAFLKELLLELDAGDIDMDLTGFTEKDIEELMTQFNPGTEEEQGRLDQLEPKIVKCPHCQREFDAREQM